MIQTWALFVDAYRELNSKKLFWLVLGLSLLIVACFAGVGINEKGLEILVWELPIPILNTNVMSEAFFYRLMFITLGIGIWLAWAATILALISTAGIFPDFLASGAIELTLSKPIGRFRLFLTKYATGLLFVAVQVSVFTAASFVVIGLRGKVWDINLFWSIPLVLSFFSYVYSFSVLIAVLTRSTMGAFLITLLLWCLIFLVHAAESGIVLQFRVRADQVVTLQQAELDAANARLETARSEQRQLETAPGAPPEQADPAKAKAAERVQTTQTEIAVWEERLVRSRSTQSKLARAHAILFAVKTVLPKTSETIELLRRKVIENTEFEHFQDRAAAAAPRPAAETVDGVRISARTLEREMQREIAERSVAWIIGTSLAFEAVLLAIGGWIFSRRDF